VVPDLVPGRRGVEGGIGDVSSIIIIARQDRTATLRGWLGEIAVEKTVWMRGSDVVRQ